MDTNQNKQNYALPITMMFALFFMIAFVTGLQNPLGQITKSQFNLTDAEAQLPSAAAVSYTHLDVYKRQS